jgi:hypothetical protein
MTNDQPEPDNAVGELTEKMMARAEELKAHGLGAEQAWIQAALEHYPGIPDDSKGDGVSEAVETLAKVFQDAFRHRSLDPNCARETAWALALKQYHDGLR